ncbi:T9SS type A sorting domain-containing protein [candidate division TA06 bacterium]|nr:T9SS type A sorting domain-containing protein [candidate division TA06 bacterium]
MSIYPFRTNAQVTFQKTFGGAGTDYGYSVRQTTDGGYIITGYTESFGAGGRDVYLIRTDDNGNMIWTRTYGESNIDYGWTVQQTTDGGFIVGAHTGSFGAGSHDVYLIKVDANGEPLWSKVYGGSSPDGAYSMQQTTDGGYIVSAHTSSFGAGAHEIYLIKTNGNGDTLWTKTYGGSSGDYLRSVHQTTDGGYIMVAESFSFGEGMADVYLVKTDSLGDTLWTKSYGGSASDYGYSVQQTTDGGYIIAGYTLSFGEGLSDVYLIKTDSNGDTLWTKTYGGPLSDYGYSVQQMADSGYVVAGYTQSFGTNGDVYLIRTDANGGLIWAKSFGGTSDDRGWSVQQTVDGGFIIAGYTESFGAGSKDVYLIKTDEDGNSGCNQSPTNTIVGSTSTVVNSTATWIGSGAIINNTATIVSNAATVDSVICGTTGLQEEIIPISRVKIQIYPNPFSSSTLMKFKSQISENYTFVLYDLLGKEVKRIEGIRTNEVKITRGGISTGMYFYKLQNEKETIEAGKLIFIK